MVSEETVEPRTRRKEILKPKALQSWSEDA